MIHVIATISLRPGTRYEFLSAFRRLVPAVHAEAGCIEYGPAVDLPGAIEGQTAARTDVVTVIEKWRSVDDLRSHLAAKHMAEYREIVKDMVASVEIQVLQPA